MAQTTTGKDKLLRNCRLYVGGYDLSGDSRNFDNAMLKYGEVDMVTWPDTTRHFLADIPEVGLSGYQALMNDAAGRAFDQLKTSPIQSQLSLVFGGAAGPVIADPAYLLGSIQFSDLISIDGGAAILTTDFKLDSAQADAFIGNPYGVLLHPDTARTGTGSFASHNNGGATTGGYQALLHIIDAGAGTWVFKIQHGTDDAIWADLVTFTANGASITSERASGSGTVNQYTRFQISTGGTGDVIPICTFARQ